MSYSSNVHDCYVSPPICRNCKQPKEDHLEAGKCLFGPARYEAEFLHWEFYGNFNVGGQVTARTITITYKITNL